MPAFQARERRMSPDIVLLAAVCAALIYSLLSIVAALRYLAVRPANPERHRVPISILKPLAGLDRGLESNLRTFFEQDYPAFEILFAVRDPDDPAVAVIEKLRAEYPHVPSQLLIDWRAAVFERESVQPGSHARRRLRTIWW